MVDISQKVPAWIQLATGRNVFACYHDDKTGDDDKHRLKEGSARVVFLRPAFTDGGYPIRKGICSLCNRRYFAMADDDYRPYVFDEWKKRGWGGA